MPLIPPSFDWSQRANYDWTSPEGLEKLKSITAPPVLPFVPHPFQLHDSACILNGQDVFCITATGDGKSSLIYIPALARKEMITVVVEPTNALESNLATSLNSKGVSTVVINAETLAVASAAGHRLWEEARDCRYQVIALSPETLKTPEFDALIRDADFRSHWGVLVVDEAHLVDQWGAEFRKAFADIWTLRSRGPDHLTMLALSATIEKGRQMNQIVHSLGFQPGEYYLDKRDCERRNVDIILRNVLYTSTGHEFRDLDWLIPETMTRASDIPKSIVYCDTIESGHRVAHYLRSLLPPPLRKSAYTLIRHMHSINCPECKREGLEALYQSGDERETALFIATAVWEVGLDVFDIVQVILFTIALTAASALQRAGRPGRGLLMWGKAIMYIKKSQLEAALAYVTAHTQDTRILAPSAVVGAVDPQLPAEHVEDEVREADVEPLQQVGSTDIEDTGEDILMDENIPEGSVVPIVVDGIDVPVGTTERLSAAPRTASAPGHGDTMTQSGPVSVKGASKKTSKLPVTETGKKIDTSLLLIIAAHARRVCITRQINIIYDNPTTDRDCGHCSSCTPSPIPSPRALPMELEAATIEPVALPTSKSKTKGDVPAYLRLAGKDVEEVSRTLDAAARKMRRAQRPRHPDSGLLSSSCFLDRVVMKAITQDFHLLSSQEVLEARIKSIWRYWDASGSVLWVEVEKIGNEMRKRLVNRHEEALAKRRATTQKKAEESVRSELNAAGLGGVKLVKLIVRQPAEAAQSTPEPEQQALPFSPSRNNPPALNQQPIHPLARPVSFKHHGMPVEVPNLSVGEASSSKRRASTSLTSPAKAARIMYEQTATSVSKDQATLPNLYMNMGTGTCSARRKENQGILDPGHGNAQLRRSTRHHLASS